MKIAISSSGNRLDSALDPRFGRCACFLIVDPSEMSFSVLDNRSVTRSGGAGIQRAQAIVDQNVGAIITGHIGPNAAETLAAAGIDIFTGQGTIAECLERYKGGNLRAVSRPTVGRHFGMRGHLASVNRRGAGKASLNRRGSRQGSGQGPGRGAGGGMGRCRRAQRSL